MTSRHVVSPEVQCHGKVGYWEKDHAKKQLKMLRGQGRRGLDMYRCPHCAYWHLGNKPNHFSPGATDDPAG